MDYIVFIFTHGAWSARITIICEQLWLTALVWVACRLLSLRDTTIRRR